LRKQWHQELQDKFSLQALILEAKSYKELVKGGNKQPFEQANRVLICSYRFAKSKADDGSIFNRRRQQTLGLGQNGDAADADETHAAVGGGPLPAPIFTTHKTASRTCGDGGDEVVAEYELRTTDAPTRQAFLTPALRARIAEAVQERLPRVQLSVLTGANAPPELDLADVVRRTVDVVVKQPIDIPRIAVVPKGLVTRGFKPFALDVKGLHLQPKNRSLVGQTLRTHEQLTYTAQAGRAERRPEDYIVHALIDYDDIDYMVHASLLYDLAGQMVAHLQSYLPEANGVINVLDLDRQLIAKNIHAQMMEHFYESPTEYAIEVRRGFTTPKEPTYSVGAGQPHQANGVWAFFTLPVPAAKV
jgi:type III restriction enzyme